MHTHDKLLIGIGLSLATTAIMSPLVGVLSVIPVAIIGLPLTLIALFVTDVTVTT